MKNNKPLTWILAVALLGVWGAVFYSIYTATASDDPGPEPHQRAITGNAPSIDRYVYADDVRDPFRMPVIARKKAAPPKAVEPPWTPPPLALSGILVSGKKHTAILETAEGKTYFMKEGDTLAGVKIVKITAARVSYSFMNKNGEWTLENK